MKKILSIWICLLLLISFSLISAVSSAATPVSIFAASHHSLPGGKMITPSTMVSNIPLADLIEDTDTDESEDQVQVSVCIDQYHLFQPSLNQFALFRKSVVPFKDARQHLMLCVFKI